MESNVLRLVGDEAGWRVQYFDAAGDLSFASKKRHLSLDAARDELRELSDLSQLLNDNCKGGK